MTQEEWTRRALAARIEQGLPEHVEDPATLDFLADALSASGRPGPTDDDNSTASDND
jgi:hypothetical protein